MGKTKNLTFIAIFAAIVVLQNVVPVIGGLNLGVFKITLIHVTVAVSAIILGPKAGAIIGGFWGISSFISAVVAPLNPIQAMVFTNPIISVLPRILVGLVAGWLFILLQKRFTATISAATAGLLAALTNTILVLGLIYLLYANGAAPLYGVAVDELLPFLLGIVGTNGIPEALASAVLVPAIALPLRQLSQTKKAGV
jgi:uncharacterized membrane protein